MFARFSFVFFLCFSFSCIEFVAITPSASEETSTETNFEKHSDQQTETVKDIDSPLQDSSVGIDIDSDEHKHEHENFREQSLDLKEEALEKQQKNNLWALQGNNESALLKTSTIKVDDHGSVYISGSFGLGTHDFRIKDVVLRRRGDSDIFIAKLTDNGAVKWSISFGGRDSDVVSDTFVDKHGNIYIAGSVSSDPIFGTIRFPRSLGGAFLAKLDPQGKFVWVQISRHPSSRTHPHMLSITQDHDGFLYASGFFFGEVSFDQYTLKSSYKLAANFMMKLDANGRTKWLRSTNVGTNQSVFAKSIVVFDGNASLYLVEEFDESLLLNGTQFKSRGERDIIISNLRLNGSENWRIQGGGRNDDNLHQAIVDRQGALYLQGAFTNAIQFGNTNLKSKGKSDIYIAKVNNGIFVNAYSIGGTGRDTSGGIGVDLEGNLYVGGNFTGNITLGNHSYTALFPYENAFLIKLSKDGKFLQEKALVEARASLSFSSITADRFQNIYGLGRFTGRIRLGGEPLATMHGVDLFVWKTK